MRIGGWGKEREKGVVKANEFENTPDYVHISNLHVSDKCQCSFSGCVVVNHDQ